MWRLRMAVLLLLALLAVAFFVLDLGQYLSLAWLQQQRASLQLLVSGQPGLTASGYFVLYVLVCALSVPGAAVLTLAGGALFGFGWGLLLVSFASSFGATLAFWSARYVLGGWVQERFATQLKVVNQGLENDGALYLLTLRLVPLVSLVPFFVVNLALGLTRMPSRTFYAVSQVGMLPGTALFVNAGTQLAAVDSLAGVVTLPVLASLALLGAFPWLARSGVTWRKRQALYAPFKGLRPRRFDRNLIVIGAGAGGLVTAYIAAAVKAKVTLVEAHKMGGDCLNYGCVPSKALLKSAKVAHQTRHASRYGLADAEPVINFEAVM